MRTYVEILEAWPFGCIGLIGIVDTQLLLESKVKMPILNK